MRRSDSFSELINETSNIFILIIIQILKNIII